MKKTIQWIRYDFNSNPFRFIIECLAWCGSIGCALGMALTAPNPPLMVFYPIWIISCSMYAWSAFTRKSFGMLLNYALLMTIDSIGLIRMMINNTPY